MRKILQNILFVFSILALIGICAFLKFDNFLGYSTLATTNIVINLSALVLGTAIAVLIKLGRTSQESNYTVSFSILLCMICFSCMINTIECIADSKNSNFLLCGFIDSVRIYCELIIYVLAWKYISTILNINTNKQKKITKIIAIFGFICCTIYVAHLFIFDNNGDKGLIFELDIFHIPMMLLHFGTNIIYIVFITKYSKRTSESTALFIICGASILSGTFYMLSNLDIGYLLLTISLLVCYSYIYLKHVYENRQGQLIGKEVQKSFLTDNFDIMPDKIDVYAKTLPSGEVGGNFYDIYNKDDRHFTVSFADTPGIGIPAALTMTAAISLLRGLIDTSMHVNGIAQQMDYRVRTDTNRGTEISLWLGTIDFDTNTLSYVNAGNCVFIVLRNGRAIPINYSPSPKIGSPSPEKYRANEIDFFPGDMIILFTKSMKQITNSNNEKISDSFIKQILNKKNLSSKQYCESIFDYIKEFSGSKKINADITMLILKYKKDKEENISNLAKHNTLENSELDIKIDNKDNQLNIQLEGDLVKQTSKKLENNLNDAINNKKTKYINFDFSNVNLIDAYGLRYIIKVSTTNPNIHIYINKYNEYTKNFLEENGLHEILIKEDKNA